jgi:hypothetical protein
MIGAGALAHDHGVAGLTNAGRAVWHDERDQRQVERDIRRAIADGFRDEGLGGAA